MRRGALSVVVALGLTIASVRVERVGRAPDAWSQELCAPEPYHPCSEGVLQGGFPVGYIVDRPGISVMGRLALVEDLFRPWAFALDVSIFGLVSFALTGIAVARRRKTAA
jgi:hypothetical protein